MAGIHQNLFPPNYCGCACKFVLNKEKDNLTTTSTKKTAADLCHCQNLEY